MPNTNKSSKILLTIIILLVLIVLGWVGYLIWKDGSSNPAGISPSPILEISPSISPKTSPKISPSPSISPSSNADKTTLYKIPEGETYLLSSTEDTNGDSKDETLVITTKPDGLYHAYILSDTGEILYDNKEITQKPLRISAQVYEASETYPSWMLVFTEQSGNLVFIHYNGTTYEIPQDYIGI